ncbi:MAG: hypothetical protein B6D62_04440 [Candidatus Cloacimonas sp. 4484_275]|nr:MAG: hypothetical protein B6D62_04440 [Candidatus Cloacimonas sp. 4484_275]RLC52344.1 MAG: hypothetical protein DRZ79_01320 [Candidatus Cloacimonadota bacterium]
MKKTIIIVILLALHFSISARTDWLGKDKVMHFAGSAFITYWNYGVSRDIMGNSKKESIYFSVSVTSILGFGKETSDKFLKKTKFSWKDIVYDIAGISAGLIIINNSR